MTLAMKSGLALLALAAALGGCSPKSSSHAHSAGGSCAAEATRSWQIGAEIYRIDASAHGASCPDARATMILRSPDSDVLFSADYATAQIPYSFNPHGDQASLSDDLNLWIENQAPGSTASSLPEWAADAAKPLHFAPAVARDVYEKARRDDLPIFCFPDGAESDACVALDPDAHAAQLLGSMTPQTE